MMRSILIVFQHWIGQRIGQWHAVHSKRGADSPNDDLFRFAAGDDQATDRNIVAETNVKTRRKIE